MSRVNGAAMAPSRDYYAEVRESRERKSREDVLSVAQSKKLDQANRRKESSFKLNHMLLLGFLSLFIALHAIGIYLFTSGFLLTRLVLEHKSECNVPPTPLHGSHSPGSVDAGCWHPKKFNKAVIIIIDALRYDFTVPFTPREDDPLPHAFHNSFQFFHQAATAQPDHAFLRPFIADPPTTTLQRLKGLTTGTLPTFIDAGSNFAGTAIDEDNLVAQLRSAGKNVVHLGDDTWHALFPDYFDLNLTKAYDSFNVWDLHTLDNGVNEHIFPLLNPSNSSKWDVLIGHYLGVDHAGHRYGPDHPAMTAKLQQMDKVMRQVTDLIDDETLLVVMGDHGMDAKGDHGGESDDEVEAALWMYSKRKHFGRTSQESRVPPATAKSRPLAQIDLVPTLALLLGLPIPFNNLGAPIEEAFVGAKGNDFENLALVNRITAAQVHRYQDEYALVRKPDAESMALPYQLWDIANAAWTSQMKTGKRLSGEQWKKLALDFRAYQKQNLQVCKDLWARFDLISMSEGILVLAVSLFLLAIFARSVSSNLVEISPPLLVKGLLGMVAGSGLGAGLSLSFPAFGLVRTSVFSAGAGTCLVLLSGLMSQTTLPTMLFSIIPESPWSMMCVITTLLMSIGFASNSYTIWEDEMLLFFLTVFGVLMLAASLRLGNARNRSMGIFHAAVFMVSIKLASLSRLCREEQAANCRTTFYASATSSTSAPWQLAIAFLVAVILPTAIKSYYRGTQSYSGSAPFWIGVALQLCLLFIAVFWAVDAADDGDWFQLQSGILKSIRMYLAQFILAVTAGAGTATFAYQAPFMGIKTVDVPIKSKTTPQKPASGQQKDSDQAQNPETRPQLIVHGTSNLYGSHFATLPLTIFLVPLLLTQKPMGQGALALVSIAILSLLELLHLLGTQSPAVATVLSTGVGPTILALLGHFAFFKTGHQAALSSIQWDAAFIPLRTIRYPWSPLMVILNTFGGQILCAVAVPLCVLWRRSYRFSTSTPSDSASEKSDESADSQTLLSASDPGTNEEMRAAQRARLLSDVAAAVLTHVLVYATINLFTTVWAAHLRRHLMLYRVFSPRWMVGVATLLVAEFVGIWFGVGGVRYSVTSVAGVFGW